MEEEKTSVLLFTGFKKVMRITKGHTYIDGCIFFHFTAHSGMRLLLKCHRW